MYVVAQKIAWIRDLIWIDENWSILYVGGALCDFFFFFFRWYADLFDIEEDFSI